MKKTSLKCAGLLVAGSLMLTVTASATVVFSEDFESYNSTDAATGTAALTGAGYVIENNSGNGNPATWTHADTDWLNPALALGTGNGNSAIMWFDAANPNDDWLITPGFALTSGEDYFIEFDWETDDLYLTYFNTWNLFIGTTATSAGMTGSGTLLDDDATTGGAPFTSSSSFTATTTGTHFLAIQDDSPANLFYLLVDNIVVDTDPIGSGVDDWNMIQY